MVMEMGCDSSAKLGPWGLQDNVKTHEALLIGFDEALEQNAPRSTPVKTERPGAQCALRKNVQMFRSGRGERKTVSLGGAYHFGLSPQQGGESIGGASILYELQNLFVLIVATAYKTMPSIACAANRVGSMFSKVHPSRSPVSSPWCWLGFLYSHRRVKPDLGARTNWSSTLALPVLNLHFMSRPNRSTRCLPCRLPGRR
jgi:hypothetical protein